jgi:hypothetical protein
MNTKNITLIALFLMLTANTVLGASICNKDNICQWQKGEKVSTCIDCAKTIYPEIKFINSSISVHPQKFIDMDDFGESNIKFSIRAINGNIYILGDPAYCNIIGAKNLSVLLAETSYDPKAKIYLIPENKTIIFECKTLFMPDNAGSYTTTLDRIFWGTTAKTAKNNEINVKNYPELTRFSSYPAKVSIGSMRGVISGYYNVLMQNNISELEKQLEIESKNTTKKKANRLKLEINQLKSFLEKYKVK